MQLVQAAAQHKDLLERKRKELAQFQTQYSIQVKNTDREQEAAVSGGAGVLVEKS